MKLTTEDIFNASILIVDDQQPNITLLEAVLFEAGYKNVSSTLNPVEVAALHQQKNYDLILLDLQMPEMDGFQVMDRLKANLEDGYLPVLVLTAQPAHKLQALQSGAKDFISKPFDMIEIQTRIHNLLEVRLLYKKLESYAGLLEETVLKRTAELRESEARFRSLTELASDWYWEQDENGKFTQVSGPVPEMLGIQVNSSADINTMEQSFENGNGTEWTNKQRRALQDVIATRQPFVDFSFSRVTPSGEQQYYRVSGAPIFDKSSRFIGYRGIGIECKQFF